MRTLWLGYMAIGLAGVVGVVPASFAQDPQVLDHGKLAGTAIQTQTHDEMSAGLRSEAPGHAGVFVAEPIGKVWVGPESLDGEPSYVRRTKDKGITIVEVSTTPFMPEVPGVDVLIGKSDQPAGW